MSHKLRQGQKPAPGHTVMERSTGLANLFQLRTRNPWLIGRTVVKPGPPDNRPHQTHSAQYPEDGPPAKTYLQRNQGKRRHRRAQPARSPHHALAARSLLLGKPMRNDTGRIGISAGCAHPEQKAGNEELPESAAPAGERREDRPPGSNAGQLGTLPVPITQSTRGNFEYGIGDHVRTQHPSPLARA